jgi:hypothetical protein
MVSKLYVGLVLGFGHVLALLASGAFDCEPCVQSQFNTLRPPRV